jgi:transposase
MANSQCLSVLQKEGHNERPMATGRKNWIHLGSQQAGAKVAAILSVVESCRRRSIPVRDYLKEILPGLANRSIQLVAGLTPAAWIAKHTPNNS